ncbi:hypothetical protein FIC94_19905 [Ochrobactrum teleogrylli]|uniref:Uncharacterized protein n=1 Tax=Ochrobactrum teleogrylli TaxID=2479765 RepID=A0ABY2Y1N9_9HYPH|nr:hypothetical protein FIC94_19905 [[Ochrobactrum] teleogrylli]
MKRPKANSPTRFYSFKSRNYPSLVSDPKVAMPVCKWQFLRLPRLTYLKVRSAPVLEITIFATACRFLIQTP